MDRRGWEKDKKIEMKRGEEDGGIREMCIVGASEIVVVVDLEFCGNVLNAECRLKEIVWVDLVLK